MLKNITNKMGNKRGGGRGEGGIGRKKVGISKGRKRGREEEEER